MYLRKSRGPRTATLGDGSTISLADLPPVETRWVASRKAVVCRAISAGIITRDEAINRWELSDEELDGWMQAVDTHGPAGLKVTLVQKYRQARIVE